MPGAVSLFTTQLFAIGTRFRCVPDIIRQPQADHSFLGYPCDIVGNFGGPVQPGVIGFGFVVSILQSFIQVARVNGRCILRDGHHRAIGFLKRGIETVPVITRDYGEFEELGIGPGLLPTAAYLGPRPPLLVDYFDDVVSADVSLPAFQRMIVIHGLELTPMG